MGVNSEENLNENDSNDSRGSGSGSTIDENRMDINDPVGDDPVDPVGAGYVSNEQIANAYTQGADFVNNRIIQSYTMFTNNILSRLTTTDSVDNIFSENVTFNNIVSINNRLDIGAGVSIIGLDRILQTTGGDGFKIYDKHDVRFDTNIGAFKIDLTTLNSLYIPLNISGFSSLDAELNNNKLYFSFDIKYLDYLKYNVFTLFFYDVPQGNYTGSESLDITILGAQSNFNFDNNIIVTLAPNEKYVNLYTASLTFFIDKNGFLRILISSKFEII